MRSKFWAEWPRDVWSYKGCYLIVKKNYVRTIRDMEDDALSIACVVEVDRNILLVMQEDDRTRFCKLRIYFCLLMSSAWFDPRLQSRFRKIDDHSQVYWLILCIMVLIASLACEIWKKFGLTTHFSIFRKYQFLCQWTRENSVFRNPFAKMLLHNGALEGSTTAKQTRVPVTTDCLQ